MLIPTSAAPLPALDASQAAVLAAWDGPLLVLGGPGTGKTTVVAHAAAARVRSGGPGPLVLAGGRTAASALRNRISAELGEGSWRLTVTTVHALCRSLWQRFADRPDVRLLAAPEQEFRVRELLAGTQARSWPDRLGPALGTRGFAAHVRAALARARQLGLDPEDLIEFGTVADRPEWTALGGFFAEYLDVLDAEGVLDYAELVHRVRLLLSDPAIAGIVGAEIGSILVDDYSELDPAQIGLLSGLGAGGQPLLATADPDSTSSTFRGAHPRSVAGFAEQFDRPEAPAAVLRLRQGHRAGPVISAALAGVRVRLPQPAGAPSAAADSDSGAPGSVQVFSCAGEAEQGAAIAAELRRARLEDGLDYSQMAVLVRSGRHQLGPIARSLTAAGIPVEVAGDEIALAQAPAIRPLLLALTVVLAGQVAPEEAQRLLTSPLVGFDALGLRRLSRAWRQTRAQTDGLGLPGQLAAAINQPDWLQRTEPTPDLNRLRSLVELLSTARAQLAGDEPVDRISWTLWRGSPWPDQLAREANSAGAASTRADVDLDAVCAFFELAAEAGPQGGAAGLRAFLAELSGQQIPADIERESRPRRRGVQLLTAHRSRGREWELVVLAGVQEGIWPVGRRLSTVLDTAELTAEGIGRGTDQREVLAAERRLFHLACSRARRRLVVIAAAGTAGEADSPSRFLAELGVPTEPAPSTGAPLTLGALVAELRRCTTDPAVAPELRQAATIELARLADATDGQGRPLAPAADPGRWWGVRALTSPPRPLPNGQSVRLSPSQVTSVLTCPRRYFLSRQADGGTGMAATLGSLIHLLVQQAVTHDWSLAEMTTRLDQLWPRLPFEAAWLSASERVDVELALARFLNWRQARSAELVGVEVPFALRMELDGLSVELDGKVDWLERSATGLRVVDFKTARSAPTRAQIAGLEQLGVYQLAVAAGGFAGQDCTEPDGATAVYLRQSGASDELPKEFEQESLARRSHLGSDPDEADYPSWVHHRVAQAAAVVADGSYPATPGAHCRGCVFATSCPASPRGRQVVP